MVAEAGIARELDSHQLAVRQEIDFRALLQRRQVLRQLDQAIGLGERGQHAGAFLGVARRRGEGGDSDTWKSAG